MDLLAVIVLLALALWLASGRRQRRERPTDEQILEARERRIKQQRLDAVNDFYKQHPEQHPDRSPHWW